MLPRVADSVLAFVPVALAVVLMPGADTVLVLRTSLRQGTRAGVITAAGIVCGPVIWGALAGLGVALLLSQNAHIYAAGALAGGLYLAYLAYRALLGARTAWRSTGPGIFGDEHAPMSVHHATTAFLTGLITNLLNPKIGVFYVAVLPGLFLGQPITVAAGALLGTIHAVLGLAFLTFVAVFSGFARTFFTRPMVLFVIELCCALCLFGFSVFVVSEAVARALGLT